jgi:2-haloacid dehalogenase
VAASAIGLPTAFVPRPTEYGLNQTADQSADNDYDMVSNNFTDLATQLGTWMIDPMELRCW